MIGGLQPCSFVDFPGCLSAVVFFRGCNLRCPYCHNKRLLDGDDPPAMTETELLAFLSSRRGRLDGVVISGGEPTLQAGLRRCIEAVRVLGYKVKLDTNGTRPQVLSELIGDGLIDYVALDLKDEPHAYASWLGTHSTPEDLCRSLELVKTSGADHELRTTVTWPHHDEERLDRMARWAHGCRRWILQPCRADAKPPPSVLDPSADAVLEDLAMRLRTRHGVPCRCRSERTRLRSSTTTNPVQKGEITCP